MGIGHHMHSDEPPVDSHPREAPEISHAGDAAEPVGVPIACSLSRGELVTRLRQWQELLSDVIERRPIEGGVSLIFSNAASRTAIADLADQEHACCPFLDFTVSGAQAAILEVRAPAAAQDIIRELFGSS